MSERWTVDKKLVKRAHDVFEELLLNLPERFWNLQFAIVVSEWDTYEAHKGAFTVNHVVCLGSSYLNHYPNKEDIAAVLCHELGHQVLGHTDHEGFDTRQQEHDADHFGLMLYELAGYCSDDYMQHYVDYESGPFRRGKMSKEHIEEHGTGTERVEILENYLALFDDE